MVCKDQIEPVRPLEVSARPEWPNIIENNYGWNCHPVLNSVSGISNATLGNCCMYVENGLHNTREECEEATECDSCGSPTQVMDMRVSQPIYDSDFVATILVNGALTYIFMERYFAPVEFYYIGEHGIFGDRRGLGMDPDKQQHTWVETAHTSCDAQGENCTPVLYEYASKNAYAPRTLYKQVNTRFVGYDKETLEKVGLFGPGQYDSDPTWNEARKGLIEAHGEDRPVFDQDNNMLGIRQVFTEYNPYYRFWPDYEEEYSYAQWKEFLEHPDYNDPDNNLMYSGSVPNEALVSSYINGDEAIRTELQIHMQGIEYLAEWYRFMYEQIDPPGWVDGGWPNFIKGNSRFSWEGRFIAPLEKILNRRALFHKSISLKYVSSNLNFRRYDNQSMMAGQFPYYTDGDLQIRHEKYNDRQYINDGSKLVRENQTTGTISFTDIPVGVQGIQSNILHNVSLKVLNPEFDDVYTGTVDSLWSSTSGTHCFEEQFSIDGVYPLYLSKECAYKHDEDGEYIIRRFYLRISGNQQGEFYDVYHFYQPKGYNSTYGNRYDGGFEGGNGEYKEGGVGFEEWLVENPNLAPDQTNYFIPFKPVSGPSGVALEKGVVVPVPTLGPANSFIVSGVVLPPGSGPYNLFTLTNFYTPPTIPIETGPSNIALVVRVPESGPKSAALFDRSNPPITGPATTVLLEVIFPPVYGPETILLIELPPEVGPSSITLIELAPSTGPSNTELVKTGTTIDGVIYPIPLVGPVSLYPDKAQPLSGPDSIVTNLLPANGPVSLYPDKAQPLSGPDSIVAHLLPANGPVDTSLVQLAPAVGPTSIATTATYGCFGASIWYSTDHESSGRSNAVIEGLTSGARTVGFTVDISTKRFLISEDNIYTTQSGQYIEGELIKVSNADVEGYYRIATYSYDNIQKRHWLYLSCDDMMPMKGPSSIDSVKLGTTVDGVTYLLPTQGPKITDLFMAVPETGPNSADVVISPPLSGPRTLTPTELIVTIDNFFTSYTNGFSSGEQTPANMAFHPFVRGIESGDVDITLSGIGPGNYNTNKEGDSLTFDNPYNYSHAPSITVNSSTGKNMYAYNGYGTVSIDCTPLMGTLTVGQKSFIKVDISHNNQYFSVDSTPTLVNCTQDYWYSGGTNYPSNYSPRIYNRTLSFRIEPTQSGTCSVTVAVKTGTQSNNAAYGTKLLLTLTWNVPSGIDADGDGIDDAWDSNTADGPLGDSDGDGSSNSDDYFFGLSDLEYTLVELDNLAEVQGADYTTAGGVIKYKGSDYAGFVTGAYYKITKKAWDYISGDYYYEVVGPDGQAMSSRLWSHTSTGSDGTIGVGGTPLFDWTPILVPSDSDGDGTRDGSEYFTGEDLPHTNATVLSYFSAVSANKAELDTWVSNNVYPVPGTVIKWISETSPSGYADIIPGEYYLMRDTTSYSPNISTYNNTGSSSHHGFVDTTTRGTDWITVQPPS